MEKSAENLRDMLSVEKDLDPAGVAQLALDDGQLLDELLEGLLSRNDVYRYNCFKALLLISQDQPLVLLPQWDRFVAFLDSDNAYHRSTAINLLTNLARVDAQGKFEGIFDRLFDLLDDQSVVVARYLAQNAGKIARAKPHLQPQITARLLDLEKTHHAEGRKDLIKGDAIESFEAYFAESPDQQRMLAFAEGQLACSSPRTRRIAKDFVSRHGK
jgi:hypothetical protein